MSKIKWKEPLLLVLPVIGLLAFGIALQMRNDKPGTDGDAVKSTAYMTRKIVSKKAITIDLGLVKGMADTGMLRHLSKAIKKYPKHDEVIVTWTVPQSADYPGYDNLIYNRRKGSLRYEQWWSNFCNGNNFKDVTDKAIHSAAKVPRRIYRSGELLERPPHWIKVLERFHCRLTSSFSN